MVENIYQCDGMGHPWDNAKIKVALNLYTGQHLMHLVFSWNHLMFSLYATRIMWHTGLPAALVLKFSYVVWSKEMFPIKYIKLLLFNNHSSSCHLQPRGFCEAFLEH